MSHYDDNRIKQSIGNNFKQSPLQSKLGTQSSFYYKENNILTRNRMQADRQEKNKSDAIANINQKCKNVVV